MKIIHCADLHLDSRMTTHLGNEKAKERRDELLNTYLRMIAYAKDHQVDAILIAGDLFDTNKISVKTRNVVLDSIVSNPELQFYYLKGNHDKNNFLDTEEALPYNLHLFDDCWKSYSWGKITITGVEFKTTNANLLYHSLVLDQSVTNIVMMHGQEADSMLSDKGEIIQLPALKNKGIDYLALGHIHAYKRAVLDARGVYCYCGCLEGRGYDECGTHGFVLLDIDDTTGRCTDTFVPFASRTIHDLFADVSECMTTISMIHEIKQLLEERHCSTEDLLHIHITGAVDLDCEKDINYIKSYFSDTYYAVKILDETYYKINLEDYLYDESLKGEFIRTVFANKDLDEMEKETIIRFGLQAIAGEVIQ